MRDEDDPVAQVLMRTNDPLSKLGLCPGPPSGGRVLRRMLAALTDNTDTTRRCGWQCTL
jgi:hypothetical protein